MKKYILVGSCAIILLFSLTISHNYKKIEKNIIISNIEALSDIEQENGTCKKKAGNKCILKYVTIQDHYLAE